MQSTRARKLGAFAAAAGAGIILTASPAAAVDSEPVMTATPNTNLTDGQKITVTYDTGTTCTSCTAPYAPDPPLGLASEVHFVEFAVSNGQLTGLQDLGPGTNLTLSINAQGRFVYKGDVMVKKTLGTFNCTTECAVWMAQTPLGTGFPAADAVQLSFKAPK